MKKIITYILVFTLVMCSFASLSTNTAKAASVGDSEFNAKIATLKTKFVNGQYWNAYNPAGYEGTGPNKCPSCSNKSYCAWDCPDRCGQFYYGGSWISGQCLGFACKLGNAIFGGNPLTWSQHKNANNIRPGDIVYGNLTSVLTGTYTHAIFITGVSGNKVTYADCNSGGPCKVNWDRTTTISALTTATSRGAVIYHASNNTCVTGGSGVASQNWTKATVTVGSYQIKNVGTGKYLNLTGSNNADAVNINVTAYSKGSLAQTWDVITTGSTGAYKLRTHGATRLVNPYSNSPVSGTNVNIYHDCGEDKTQIFYFQKVTAGFVIRLAYDTNLCLNVDGSNNVNVTTYTGAKTQIWVLETSVSQPSVTLANYKDGVCIKWNAIGNAKSYIVYRKTGSNGSWAKIATVSSSTTTYVDRTAASGKQYYYGVCAVDGNAKSAYKTNTNIKYLSQPSVALKNTKSGIQVTWSKSNGATQYLVYRKTGSGSYVKIATVSSKTSYVDKTAKNGLTYTYAVRAYNGGYYSSYTGKSVRCKK